MPNREYYAQLAKMDTSQLFYTISSMLTYAGFEFLSFLMMSYILQKKLRLNSIRQLAFVLDNQWTMVQSKLSMSLFYVVNMSLAHFGTSIVCLSALLLNRYCGRWYPDVTEWCACCCRDGRLVLPRPCRLAIVVMSTSKQVPTSG